MKRIFAIGVLAAAFAALAPAANAQITAPDGGTASVGVSCVTNLYRSHAWGSTYKTTNYAVRYMTYVYSETFPARSGWSNQWYLMRPGSDVLGSLATLGSGKVAVYVAYELWDGRQWLNYGGEWLWFHNVSSYYCFV